MMLNLQDIVMAWERQNRYPEEIRRIEEKYSQLLPSEAEEQINAYCIECCDEYFKFGFRQAIALLTANK